MKLQGTDDASIGSLKMGVNIEEKMINYCFWERDPITVEPKLKAWVKIWIGVEVIFLIPVGWFITGLDIHRWAIKDNGIWYPNIASGTYVWAPPPAAADTYLEQ